MQRVWRASARGVRPWHVGGPTTVTNQGNETELMTQTLIPFEEGIASQPEVLGAVAAGLRERLDTAPRPQRPAFYGIGASYAALGAPVYWLVSHGLPAARFNVGEVYQTAAAFGDVSIVLSQSGRSRETVELFGRLPDPRLAVVNAAGSPLENLASDVIGLGAVPDSLASTAGYTASLMALGMLAERCAFGAPGNGWASLGERLGEWVERSVLMLDELTTRLADAACLDVVGSAPHVGAAEAAALLLREVVRVPAAAFEARQYLHGANEPGGAVGHVVIGAADVHAVSRPLSAAGHRVIAVVEEEAGVGSVPGCTTVVVPGAGPVEQAIFLAVLFQHLSARLAAAGGIDPDEFLYLSEETKILA